MIQISNPTQIPFPTENSFPVGSAHDPPLKETGAAENYGNEGQRSVERAAQRRNRAVFFTKLLEGLSSKGKSEAKTEDKGEDPAALDAENGSFAENLTETAAEFSSAEKVDAETTPKIGSGPGKAAKGGGLSGGDFFGAEADSAGSAELEARLTENTPPEGELRFARKSRNAPSEGPQGKHAGEDALKALKSTAPENENLQAEGLHGAEDAEAGKNSSKDVERLLSEGGFRDAKTRHAEGGKLSEQADAARILSAAASPSAKGAHAAGGASPDEASPGNENSASAEGASPRSRKGRLNSELRAEFRDFRTEAAKEAGGAETAKNAGPDAAAPQSAETEILVDLKLPGGREAAGSAGATSSLAGSFEDALAGQLRGNLSADIVQNATIIARNGGEGTIRLALHPASLGDVKIRIEMAENKITGFIIVESDEALRAFERELPVLEKAFRDSGFSETNLEMSLAQDNGREGWNLGGRHEEREGDFSAVAPLMAASRYDADAESIDFSESAAPPPDGEVFSAAPGRTPVNLLV